MLRDALAAISSSSSSSDVISSATKHQLHVTYSSQFVSTTYTSASGYLSLTSSLISFHLILYKISRVKHFRVTDATKFAHLSIYDHHRRRRRHRRNLLN